MRDVSEGERHLIKLKANGESRKYYRLHHYFLLLPLALCLLWRQRVIDWGESNGFDLNAKMDYWGVWGFLHQPLRVPIEKTAGVSERLQSLPLASLVGWQKGQKCPLQPAPLE